MSAGLDQVKAQIVCTLGHPEADEGLYLRNFLRLHEEDARPDIVAEPAVLVQALNELVVERKVVLERGVKDEVVFRLAE